MKWFFIRPFDTLFFRDARPFIAGEDNLAQSLFPPSPSVTYGAVRTASLVHADVNLIEFKNGKSTNVPCAAGNPTGLGTLHLAGPILARRQAGSQMFLLFPAPLNLVCKDDYGLEFLLPQLSANNTNMYLSLNFCLAQGKVEYTGHYLLSHQAFNLLAGITPNKLDDLTSQEEIWKSDERVGIARARTRTAEEGMLYSAQHIQMDNHPQRLNWANGLAVKVLDGENDLPCRSTIQVGGEKRFCELEEIPINQLRGIKIDEISKIISKNQRFFVWLVTPAVFKYGFLPGFIEPGNLTGHLDGLEVKLVACQVGRAVNIGGWDIIASSHKPMRRAVPAGSIYFFEFSNNKPEEIKQFVERWMLCPIPGQMPDYEKQGFGTILIGGY